MSVIVPGFSQDSQLGRIPRAKTSLYAYRSLLRIHRRERRANSPKGLPSVRILVNRSTLEGLSLPDTQHASDLEPGAGGSRIRKFPGAEAMECYLCALSYSASGTCVSLRETMAPKANGPRLLNGLVLGGS